MDDLHGTKVPYAEFRRSGKTYDLKTMDCSKLGLLIENGERLDLVDVRPRDKFAAAHIPGARSMPLIELSQPHLFRRTLPMTQRVYVISDGRGSASLAAGILKASNDVDAVVIDGGIKAWIDHGLPIRRAKWVPKIPTCLRSGAALLALAGIGFAFSRPWAAAAVLIVGAALLLEAQLLERTGQSRKTTEARVEDSDSGWFGVTRRNEPAAAY